MPTQVQFRRGSTAQNNNFTGAAGEITVNTSNSTLRVHDGTTAGGRELATVLYVNNEIANVIGAAPDVLDTLNEIAAAINDDPSFFSNVAVSSGLAFNQANAAYNRANVAIESLTTANVIESGNLYFTTDRANTSIDNRVTKSFVENLGIDVPTTDLTGNILSSQLEPTGVAAATYGSGSQVPVIVVDNQGRITSAANVSVAGVSTFTASGNTFTIATADGGSFTASIQENSVRLGTDTTGAYLSNIIAGTGITITGLGNEGTTPTITNAGVTSVNSQTGAATGFATTANSLSQFASTTSAQLATLISDETGTGNVVFATSPTLVTPVLGTPSSGNLINATSLPIVNGTTGTLSVARGGTGATDAGTAITNLGATTVGGNFFTLVNPSAITFPRINANNTLSALSADDFRTAIGAGTSSTTGTVTSVGGTGTVSGLTLSGTVTTTGSLTLGGTLAVTASNFASQTANTFLVAPSGTAGVPTFRAITSTDIASSALATGTASDSTYLRGDRTWATVSAGATLSNDTSTNSNAHYPAMSTSTSGSWTAAVVSSTKFFFNPSTGTLNSTVFNSLSDVREKENIQTLEKSLDKVTQMRGVSFILKDSRQKSIGVIAQEIEEILPEVVATSEQGIKSVSYGNIVGLLIEAIKEQQIQINTLKEEIAKIK